MSIIFGSAPLGQHFYAKEKFHRIMRHLIHEEANPPSGAEPYFGWENSGGDLEQRLYDYLSENLDMIYEEVCGDDVKIDFTEAEKIAAFNIIDGRC